MPTVLEIKPSSRVFVCVNWRCGCVRMVVLLVRYRLIGLASSKTMNLVVV